jgi:MFS family permease
VAATFVVNYPSLSWRGPYWLLVAINAVALVFWVLFYFPPTFEYKHKDQGDASKKLFWIKHYDYVGTLLFAAGFVIFLLGLNWGGSVYPWTSGKVIGFIVGGFAILVVFVLYECYMPLKAPFVPMHLFKNQGWVIACILLGIGAGVYYAFAVILPMQAAVLYTNGDILQIGLIGSLVGCGIISGQMTGGWLARAIGRSKYQVMAMFLLGGTFLGCKYPPMS